jgi:hypothetical protein
LTLLDVESSYWDLAWPMVIMSTGIGFCTAPPTSAIMNTAPDDKQGVASAVNDTTREIGAALGIALAGSMLASRYGDSLGPRLAGFPAPVREAATNSLGQALEVARPLGASGVRLADLSKAAFVDAMGPSVLVLSAVVAVAAVLIGLWAPGRDDEQLRLVRRLRTRASRGRHRA